MHTGKSNAEVRDAFLTLHQEEIHIHGCVENRLFGARGLTCLCHCPNVFKAHSSAIMLFLTLHLTLARTYCKKLSDDYLKEF